MLEVEALVMDEMQEEEPGFLRGEVLFKRSPAEWTLFSSTKIPLPHFAIIYWKSNQNPHERLNVDDMNSRLVPTLQGVRSTMFHCH